MPPKAPSGKVNVSVQPKCGKLLLPYKYERPSKITFSQTLALLGKIYNSNYFFLNHTQINYHLKDEKIQILISKKEQPKYILLNYAKLHYLSLVYCKDQDSTLEVGGFSFTPFTALTQFFISFTHPCKKCQYTDNDV